MRLLLRGLVLATGSLLGSGAEGRTRTADTYIFSVVLYQLSYLGTRGIVSARLGRRQAAFRPRVLRRYTSADADDPDRLARAR